MMPRPSGHRMVLYYSASHLLARHMLSDRSEDLDQSIGHFTEANRHPLRVWYGPTVDTALDIVAGFILIKGPPSDRSVKSLREASVLCPNSRTLSFALAGSLARRFFQAPTDHDYEEAAAILSRIIASPGTGDRPDKWWDMSTRLIVPLATARSAYYRKLEYAEEAMAHIRALLDSPILSDEDRRSAIENLEKLANNRFWCFTYGDSSALKEALSLDPEAIRLSPSWHSDSPEVVVANTGTTMTSRPTDEAERSPQNLQQRLSEIWKAYNTKISRTNDTADIEEAIKYFRSLLDQTPPGNASSIRMATFLGYFHGCLFQRTQKLEDLVESIDLLRSVLKVPAGQEFAEVVGGMVTSILVYRLHSAHSDPDKDEANQAIDDYFHLITDNIYTPVPRRLVLACLWAQWSREAGPPSVSIAYDKAMSLLQECVTFAPILQVQHAHLVSMLSVAKELPLDYASYLVHTDKVKQAIESLERGRALFWSELRGFRTSIDQLSMVDLLLAERFTAINQNLERLTMSPLPNSSTEVNGGETTYREGVGPFGRVLLRQRRLLDERDRAISQVQTLPGFENFLRTLSFDTLRSAASRGPLIIINHSKWRSDILILLYDSPPSLIPTSEGFYDHAIRLRDKLIDARKNSCLDSKSYGRALASVLADLYELVGQPVINRIEDTRAITRLVVPDIRILFASSLPCNGSYSVR
ncbi:hypothetical protein BC826DRAFT_1175597 [Russula brevipes]|nr:hypothetical protein BC826DRAFT_1175597 [Russula brevipes]